MRDNVSYSRVKMITFIDLLNIPNVYLVFEQRNFYCTFEK